MEYTGSSYKGRLDQHKHFDYKGVYNYPTGSRFRGEFLDGRLHGRGTVYLPNGTEFQGVWSDGLYNQGTIVFKDGLSWTSTDWDYCTLTDRRFNSEIIKGLKPAGRSQLTDQDPPPPAIPENSYDTGDGFYDPVTGNVTSYTGKFIRHSNDEERAWIISNCRKGWDQVVGKRFTAPPK